MVLGGDGRIMNSQPRLLGQLPRRRLRQILVVPYEASGECPPPLERGLAPAYRQRAQSVTSHGEHDQVHGDGERRES